MAITNETTKVTCHAGYAEMLPRWTRIEHALEDETKIKEKGTTYLPMPGGMKDNPNVELGKAMYQAYKTRAIFYSYPRSTVAALMGLLTKKPTKFEVPSVLEPMLNEAGVDQDELETIRNRVLENQLSFSRYGVLLDVADGEGTEILPHMVEYTAKNIVNWVLRKVGGKITLVAVVLDESSTKIGVGFAEEEEERFRVCALHNYNGKEEERTYFTFTTDAKGINSFDIDDEELPEGAVTPMIVGKTLPFIPFQIFNSLSLEWDMELPCLMQLVDISFALYRGEADYRHTLYMQGQGTPYAIGVDKSNDSITMGGGKLMTISNDKAKVGFLEISGQGLTSQEKALNDLHLRAKEQGVSLQEAGSQQSGEALGVRVGIKTASLTAIARINAQGFSNLLKWCAKWKGADETKIKVTPNIDFAQNTKTTKELIDMVTACEKGLVRLEDLYNFQVKNEYTTAATFDEWKNDLEQNGFSALLGAILPPAGEESNASQSGNI